MSTKNKPTDTGWVSCLECGYEMDSTLSDCSCERCDACNWSEPYSDEGAGEREMELPRG